ncbi:hypothetical protein [Sphingobium fuliginis]|jgi:hypothetical protein|uniref:hypothetical protein n=1 Tax=Sphingobium fuliginis (strain ATCC 27551) TaxID=336203 RepID=UPI0037CAA053
MSQRGTGRTIRQLERLPDGGFFLVPNHCIRRHCQGLLRDSGRDPRSINIVTADLAERDIWGVRVKAWDVDHAYFEVAGRRGQRAFDCLGMAAGKGPLSHE